MPRKGKAGKGKGPRRARGGGGGDGKRVRLQATTTAAATTTSTAADNTATPTRVSAPATQPRTHKEPRARPGRDWREDDYRAALQACAHAPPSTSVTTPRRTVPRDADAPAAAGEAPSAEAPSQCRPRHRKQLFNNLGVILVQKHTPLDQDGQKRQSARREDGKSAMWWEESMAGLGVVFLLKQSSNRCSPLWKNTW